MQDWETLRGYEKKKDFLIRALEIDEKHDSKSQPPTIIALTDLGNTWRALKGYEKQRHLLTKAFEIKEKDYNKEHLDTFSWLNNLGSAWGNSG